MKITVHPVNKLEGTIQAQPSKNYTTRYLYAAALADGESIVENIALSEDAKALIACLQTFGAEITFLSDNCVKVIGFGKNPKPGQTVNPDNAGTVLRLLIGCAALTENTTFITNYEESLGKRPNQDLLDALSALNIDIDSNENGTLPITLHNRYEESQPSAKIEVSGNISSQFLSSLLFICPLLSCDSEIKVIHDLKSKPLIRQTLEVLRKAGLDIESSDDLLCFSMNGNQQYIPQKYTVGGDHPGTAAILAACSVVPSDVTITHLYNDEQGEKRVIYGLQDMGVPIKWDGEMLNIKGSGQLKEISFDGDLATDGVLALSAATALSNGKSEFLQVENLRYKECDRITDWGTELKKLGVDFSETKSTFSIMGSPQGYEGGITLDSHIDHRVIMGLCIIGLRCRKPIVITEAQHIAKSYPGFFDHMKQLGAMIDIED